MRIPTALAALGFMLSASPAYASEYCVKKYEASIRNADAELATILERQLFLDKEIPRLQGVMNSLSNELIAILQKDPQLSDPANRARVEVISREHAQASKQKDILEVEGYANRERAADLRTKVPAELGGQLRGCVEAVAPTNTLVNLTIQTLAMVMTGGASLLLPEKALYVDMGEVLHGRPLGGDNSVVNKARDDAMRELGINPKSTVGVVVRRPECIIKGIFGKCD